MIKQIKVFLFGEEEATSEEKFKDIELEALLKATEKGDHKEISLRLHELKLYEEIEKTRREEQPEKKTFISGDTVLKVGAAVGLALLGWHAEQSGLIIPKCFGVSNASTIMKL